MPDRLPANPFYYVRHGETDWNRENRLQGWADIPLNETGREQAHLAARSLTGVPISSICASPLDRALETATIIQKAINVPMDIIQDLKEVDIGDHEGVEKGQWYTDWQEGKFTPTGGETQAEFLERILSGMAVALDRPGPVLVVAHGQIFRTLTNAIGAHLDQSMPNGIPAYLEPKGLGWSLELLETV
jgi:broad specificity phosphatase PhoE